jgi:hypothetical protein
MVLCKQNPFCLYINLGSTLYNAVLKKGCIFICIPAQEQALGIRCVAVRSSFGCYGGKTLGSIIVLPPKASTAQECDASKAQLIH